MKSKNNPPIVFMGNTAWSMYNFRKGVLAHFVNKGVKCYVLAPDDKVFSKKIQDLGCSFYSIEMNPKGVNPIDDVAFMISCYKLFKRIRPQCIFSYTIKPNIYGSIAASFFHIPFIAITTGLGFAFINENLVSFICILLYKCAFHSAYKVGFLNTEDRDVFLNRKIISKEKAFLLNSEGIDLSFFAPRHKVSNNNKQFVFLFIGRLLSDKGIREYVSVARQIKKELKNITFQVLGFAGANNPSAISDKELKTWENEGTIDFLGQREDVRPIIEKADCIVLPSYYREGIPRTLMEAAAMEKPIITTNSIGCKNTVENGITGLLCEPKSVSSLYSCCVNMLNKTQAERLQMGKKGRQKMLNEFDERIIISQYDQLQKSVCSVINT